MTGRVRALIVMVALLVVAAAGSATSAAPRLAAVSDSGDSDSADSITSSSTQAYRAVTVPTAYVPVSPESLTSVDSVTRSAVFGPTTGISVANLTVTPGQYVVGYTFESHLSSAYAPGAMTCGIVDNNGVDRFIGADALRVTSSAGWQSHSFVTSFNLGDVTLGIRCDPESTGLYRASFRDVEFWVVRMPWQSTAP